jgi:hypothetical protein
VFNAANEQAVDAFHEGAAFPASSTPSSASSTRTTRR